MVKKIVVLGVLILSSIAKADYACNGEKLKLHIASTGIIHETHGFEQVEAIVGLVQNKETEQLFWYKGEKSSTTNAGGYSVYQLTDENNQSQSFSIVATKAIDPFKESFQCGRGACHADFEKPIVVSPNYAMKFVFEGITHALLCKKQNF